MLSAEDDFLMTFRNWLSSSCHELPVHSPLAHAVGFTMKILCHVILLACASPLGASAAAPAPSENECVEVEIAGRKEQSFSCFAEKMLPRAATSARRPPRQSGAQEIVQRPSNQLGLYNRAAISHRMGNTFGTSVTAQRPNTPPPPSQLIPGR